MSRRHDPVHDRQVLLAVDLQTVPGPYWLMLFDDEWVEGLCVAAASLARTILRENAACGLLLGAQLAGGRRWAFVPPAAATGQLGRIEDILARAQPILSLPFERLLGVVPRRIAPGATVVTLSARDPEPYLERLRHLGRSGYAVVHLAFGREREEHRARAAAARIATRIGDLAPDWRSADALAVAR